MVLTKIFFFQILQFEKTGEILDESGTICNSFPVDEMEGAAGVFIHDINDPTKGWVYLGLKMIKNNKLLFRSRYCMRRLEFCE